jgi:hypothetical protein
MRPIRALATLSCLLLPLVAAPLGAQKTAPPSASPAADREAVRRAVLDYVEGFYEGDSTKLVRSIRPEFYKYGFAWEPDSSRYRGMRMSWQAAMDFANRVKARKQQARPGSPKEVVLLDVVDQTASAKLTAWWGIDYLLLGKYDGKWMISHVLWQSPPPSP